MKESVTKFGWIEILEVVAVAFAFVWVNPAHADELLEFVTDAHKASVESIHTLSCRVEFKGIARQRSSDPAKEESCSARYYYSIDATREFLSEFGKEVDALWKDSNRHAVIKEQRQGATRFGATRTEAPNRYVGRCDAFNRALLVQNIPGDVEFVPLSRLLKMATSIGHTKRVQLNNKELIELQLFFDKRKKNLGNWEVQLFFDPAVNYLIVKQVYTGTLPSAVIHREDEVVRFREVESGIFFPEQLTGRSRVGEGEWSFTSDTTFSEVQVNRALPPGIFDLRYPANVVLSDSISGTSYRVDARGRSISVPEPLSSQPPPPPPGNQNPQGLRTESLDEPPMAAPRWIVISSLLLVGLGLSLAYLRYRRRLADSSDPD